MHRFCAISVLYVIFIYRLELKALNLFINFGRVSLPDSQGAMMENEFTPLSADWLPFDAHVFWEIPDHSHWVSKCQFESLRKHPYFDESSIWTHALANISQQKIVYQSDFEVVDWMK